MSGRYHQLAVIGVFWTLLVTSCAPAKVTDQRLSLSESWGQPTDTIPEFFYADDIGPEVRAALEQAFVAATGEWGNYGPLEYWVVGADLASAEALLERYCERRDKRGDESFSDCKQYSTQSSDFLEWAERAAEMVRTGKPFLDAARTGYAHWGIHLFSSSYPQAWAGVGRVPIEDNQTVLFHEYFHAVQHAHLRPSWPRDWEKRKQLMGPVWWHEGGAEFMAHATTEKLRESGALPRESRHLSWNWDIEKEMRSKMEKGLSWLADNPGIMMAEIEYGPDKNIAYHLGSWAIAYLCDKAGPNVLLKTFYPLLNELGWEGAFIETFGMTPDEFYSEFDQFLALPIEEQVKILP